MTLFGWDCSDFDHGRGPMDMHSAARDGISFVTHKATEGVSTRHSPGMCLTAAHAAGIPFLGCYMVPRSAPPVAAQVDYFLSWVTQQVPWWSTHPGWFFQMDTEKWGYDAVSAQVGHQAAQLLAQRTGRTVLHYAPEWAYGNSVPAGEHLWASNYVAGSGWYRNLYPGDAAHNWHAYSGRVPRILQYSSSATIGGQPGCDANAFVGTTADFAALIGHPLPITEGAAVAANAAELNASSNSFALLAEMDAVSVYPSNVDGSALVSVPNALKVTLKTIQATVNSIALAVQAPDVVALSDTQLTALVSQVSAALVAAADNPLTAADLTAIDAVVAAEVGKLRLTVTP